MRFNALPIKRLPYMFERALLMPIKGLHYMFDRALYDCFSANRITYLKEQANNTQFGRDVLDVK